MIIDVIAVIVIALAAVKYSRRGFIVSLISLIQWCAGLILGFFLSGNLAYYLTNNTSMDERIQKFIMEAFPTELSSIASGTKTIFGSFSEAENLTAKAAASRITSGIMNVIAFIIIILIIAIIASILKAALKPDHGRGFIGKTDMFAGLLVGIGLGIFYVLVLLAILKPVMEILPSTPENWITEQLSNSFFTGFLYQENPLISMIKQLF